MNMKRYNVRCCCDGTKIFGTIELPVVPAESRVEVVLQRQAPYSAPSGDAITHTEEVHELQVRGWGMHDEPAVYSEDRPIEFWRQLSTFIEGDEV